MTRIPGEVSEFSYGVRTFPREENLKVRDPSDRTLSITRRFKHSEDVNFPTTPCAAPRTCQDGGSRKDEDSYLGVDGRGDREGRSTGDDGRWG